MAKHDLNSISSPGIRWVVDQAIAMGMEVEVIAEWSEARVVHMKGPLPDELRAPVLMQRPDLEFYRNGGDMHNAPDEGFMQDGWCVSFPLKK